MIVFIGLLVGIIIGVIFPGSIPDKFSPYLSIAIVACLDSVFGAIKASLKKEFQADVFISGFFGNAALLAYLGDKLGIPLYFAAVIVFGSRIFNNFAAIRRILLDKSKER